MDGCDGLISPSKGLGLRNNFPVTKSTRYKRSPWLIKYQHQKFKIPQNPEQMAPKRSTSLEHPPSASSYEEEVVSSSQEEVDDEEDEEEKVKDGDAQEVLKADLRSVWDWKEGEEGAKIGRNVGFEVEKLAGFRMFGWSVAMGEYILQKGMELLDGSKKDEMEDRLQKLHIEELELFIERIEFVRELAELVLATYNKGDED